jgi:hypothetical protein
VDPGGTRGILFERTGAEHSIYTVAFTIDPTQNFAFGSRVYLAGRLDADAAWGCLEVLSQGPKYRLRNVGRIRFARMCQLWATTHRLSLTLFGSGDLITRRGTTFKSKT